MTRRGKIAPRIQSKTHFLGNDKGIDMGAVATIEAKTLYTKFCGGGAGLVIPFPFFDKCFIARPCWARGSQRVGKIDNGLVAEHSRSLVDGCLILYKTCLDSG